MDFNLWSDVAGGERYAFDVEKMQPGDVVISRNSLKPSKLIRRMLGADYSHCAVYAGDGLLYEAVRDDDVRVVDLRLRCFDHKNTRVLRPRMVRADEHNLHMMNQYLRDVWLKKYSVAGAVAAHPMIDRDLDDDGVYCSQVAAGALARIGLDMRRILGKNTINPRDFLNGNLFEAITASVSARIEPDDDQYIALGQKNIPANMMFLVDDREDGSSFNFQLIYWFSERDSREMFLKMNAVIENFCGDEFLGQIGIEKITCVFDAARAVAKAFAEKHAKRRSIDDAMNDILLETKFKEKMVSPFLVLKHNIFSKYGLSAGAASPLAQEHRQDIQEALLSLEKKRQDSIKSYEIIAGLQVDDAVCRTVAHLLEAMKSCVDLSEEAISACAEAGIVPLSRAGAR
ncbi:hypothetical protein [Azospirillum largimobile]